MMSDQETTDTSDAKNPDLSAPAWTLMVCINRRPCSDLVSCAVRDSEKLAEAIENEVRARGLELTVERTVCMGRCDFGPTVRVAPGGDFHLGMVPADIAKFLDELESKLKLKKNTNIINTLPPIGS